MIRTASHNTAWKAPSGMRILSITVGNLPLKVDAVAKELAPTWDMVNIIKKGNKEPFRDVYGDEYIENATPEELYTRAYKEQILSKLSVEDFLNKYGAHLCIVCFCKAGDFCHRHIVAEWISEYTGEIITEL